MADLGSIAGLGQVTLASSDYAPRWFYSGVKDVQLTWIRSDQGPRAYFRQLVCGTQVYSLGGRNNTEGTPSPPSLRFDVRGICNFRWVVKPGTRSFSVDVKQAVNVSPRPRVTIVANPTIGVNSSTRVSAGSGTSWVTIGPIVITPTSKGAVWVIIESPYDGQTNVPTYWDHIVVR